MMGNYAGAAAMNAQANNAQMNAVNQATMSANGGVGVVPMGMAGQQLYAGAIGASPPVKTHTQNVIAELSNRVRTYAPDYALLDSHVCCTISQCSAVVVRRPGCR